MVVERSTRGVVFVCGACAGSSTAQPLRIPSRTSLLVVLCHRSWESIGLPYGQRAVCVAHMSVSYMPDMLRFVLPAAFCVYMSYVYYGVRCPLSGPGCQSSCGFGDQTMWSSCVVFCGGACMCRAYGVAALHAPAAASCCHMVRPQAQQHAPMYSKCAACADQQQHTVLGCRCATQGAGLLTCVCDALLLSPGRA